MDINRRLFSELLDSFLVSADAEVEEVDAGGVPALWVSAPSTSRDEVVTPAWRRLLHGHGEGL